MELSRARVRLPETGCSSWLLPPSSGSWGVMEAVSQDTQSASNGLQHSAWIVLWWTGSGCVHALPGIRTRSPDDSSPVVRLFRSYGLFPSLSLSRTHTHTNTQTHMHTLPPYPTPSLSISQCAWGLAQVRMTCTRSNRPRQHGRWFLRSEVCRQKDTPSARPRWTASCTCTVGVPPGCHGQV